MSPKKKHRFVWATGILAGVSAAVGSAAGFIATNRLMYMKKKEDDFIRQREITAKRFDEGWFESVAKHERWVDSPNGYRLKAILLEPLQTDHYVVISHGVTENKINSVKYARMFERLGFNSVIYDHRRHGDSEGKTTSFGHYEKTDLSAVVGELRKYTGEEAVIGVHGESMGAATTLLYAGLPDEQADFFIADCPFSDFTEQVLYILRRDTPLRSRLAIRLANIFLRVRDGYTLSLVSPRLSAPDIRKPVLFIHSLEDDFILPDMTRELYTLTPEPKSIRLFEKGGHAQSYNENPAEYEKTVREFLEENELLPGKNVPAS
ncbi:alpha/beta hydrolase [Bhargavaea cecembensis]|uniref:alpha/beta hydrolase n=1 Tax=Bhargavaea cecembensis TaxID=394098 RepID=UPI0006936C07|nr:alpha/beta fold hydrolase [Bhargavaea cecembensis]